MIEAVRRVVCDCCGASAMCAIESEDPIAIAQEDGWQADEDYACCPDCLMREQVIAKRNKNKK